MLGQRSISCFESETRWETKQAAAKRAIVTHTRLLYVSFGNLSGRLESTGIMPIIFALRMALPTRRWLFQVRLDSPRLRILPMSVTKADMRDEFMASLTGSMPLWYKKSVLSAIARGGPSAMGLRGNESPPRRVFMRKS